MKDVLHWDIGDDIFTTSNDPNIKTHEVMYTLINKNTTSTGYHDLTERIPQKLTQCNEYIIVGYHYDIN